MHTSRIRDKFDKWKCIHIYIYIYQCYCICTIWTITKKQFRRTNQCDYISSIPSLEFNWPYDQTVWSQARLNVPKPMPSLNWVDTRRWGGWNGRPFSWEKSCFFVYSPWGRTGLYLDLHIYSARFTQQKYVPPPTTIMELWRVHPYCRPQVTQLPIVSHAPA